VPPSGVGKREKREEGAWRGEMKGKKTRKERVKRDKGNELSFFFRNCDLLIILIILLLCNENKR
jgi:hypothetical protein